MLFGYINDHVALLHVNLILDCGTPLIDHGIVAFNDTTYNSVAYVTCDSGFSKSGPNSILCGSDGFWAPSNVSCVLTGEFGSCFLSLYKWAFSFRLRKGNP